MLIHSSNWNAALFPAVRELSLYESQKYAFLHDLLSDMVFCDYEKLKSS